MVKPQKLPSREDLEKILESSRTIFLDRDIHLLQVAAHERALTHKFAEALQQHLPSWEVDCEYNRIGHDAKELKKLPAWAMAHLDKTGRVFPDIIVHHRGLPGSQNNLAVIEAKPSTATSKDKRSDVEKLKAFKTQLGYQHAIQLTFHFDKKTIDWNFIIDD
jgi:hypothetical protein